MSTAEIIDQLSKLSEADRRLVLDKLLELEELPLSTADEALVESRLAGHRANPASSVPLDDMKRRLHLPS